jgi:uncharacterized protein (TIGR02118 family)
MVKIMNLITPKKGISTQAFKDYYENHHAPFMHRLFPMIKDYRRNYIILEGARRGTTPLPYAVIMESWFETEEDYAAFLKTAADPKLMEKISADEAQFIEPGGVWRFRVEEMLAPVQRD